MLSGNYIGQEKNIDRAKSAEYIGTTYGDTNTTNSTISLSLPPGTRKEDTIIVGIVLENSAAGEPSITPSSNFSVVSRRNGTFSSTDCTQVVWMGDGIDSGTVDIDITGYGAGGAATLSVLRNASPTFLNFVDFGTGSGAASNRTVTLSANQGFFVAAQCDGASHNATAWTSDTTNMWDSDDVFINTAALPGRSGFSAWRAAGPIRGNYNYTLYNPNTTMAALYSQWEINAMDSSKGGIFDLDDVYNN